jgi:ABC-type multidrug transport system ATPase subunit
MKGISGGEKKRLCVAIEMVSDPALLILDEPTSGLDSNKAAKLLAILKKLTASHRTVVFTLHQPSYLQFARLDRLLLLDRGETIYQGPAGAVGEYMASLGIPVSQSSTVSDFFMMEISQYKREKSHYETPFNQCSYSRRLAEQNYRQILAIKEQPLSLEAFDDIYESSFLFSFRMIFRRDCLNIFRGSWKLTVLVLQVIMKVLLLGVFFLN